MVDSQSSASRGLVVPPKTMGVSSYKVSRRGTSSAWVVVVDFLQLHIQRPQVLLRAVLLLHHYLVDPLPHKQNPCSPHHLRVSLSRDLLLFLAVAIVDSESILPVVAS